MTTGRTFEWRTEFASILILSAAAILAAWCGYQSQLWGGVQASGYTLANAIRAESIRATTNANAGQALDAELFAQYLVASAHGERKIADILLAHGRPHFRTAVEAWLKTDPLNDPKAPRSPFEMPAYASEMNARGDELEKMSEAKFDAAQRANEVADRYVRITVLVAVVSFLAAIGTKFRNHAIVVSALAVAGVVLGFSLLRAAGLPVL